jgi:hypothetical protein
VFFHTGWGARWMKDNARYSAGCPGIFNHENLAFESLLADRGYGFVYVFVPVPIKGATGSPGCPIAIT